MAKRNAIMPQSEHLVLFVLSRRLASAHYESVPTRPFLNLTGSIQFTYRLLSETLLPAGYFKQAFLHLVHFGIKPSVCPFRLSILSFNYFLQYHNMVLNALLYGH